MKIFIASDHAGFELKQQVVQYLTNQRLDVSDLGPQNLDSVDYPDFADLVCKTINPNDDEQAKLNEFGILICGSGQGMSLRANKYQHIRAALVYNDEITKLSREHNNANVICMGSRFCSLDDAIKWIETFKNTAFAQGRHKTRVAKLSCPIS